MTKTIVLGLDGANWSLLKPWIEDGTLPNLATLRAESSWGSMTSQFPPVTSPNWRCYATGRNPAKLGVFWWETVDRDQHTIHHPTSEDFHTDPLWIELANAGLKTAVLNFPTGYPPKPIPRGRFTAGGPGAKDTGFAYPATWEKELRAKYRYRVHPKALLRSAEHVEAYLDEILQIIQSRFDVAFDLLKSGVNFLHITIFYINVLQHYVYQGEPTRKAWQLIDRNLGRLHVTAKEQGYNLILMSDHGCAAVDTVFYVNRWLAQEGYLKSHIPDVTQRLGHWGLNRDRLISVARRTGVAPFLRKLIPQSWQRRLPSDSGTYHKTAKAERLDWEQSLAVGSGQGPIYLLMPPEDPNYKVIREEIIMKLRALSHPVSKQPVALRVMRREDVYHGPFFERAPDIIFEQGPGIHTSGGIGSPEIFKKPQKWTADNVLEGLFLAWGPSFVRNHRTDSVRIIDLAPTILHSMQQTIPEDMDGRVLVDLLSPTSDAAKRSIIFEKRHPKRTQAKSGTRETELADRLRALGYLDELQE